MDARVAIVGLLVLAGCEPAEPLMELEDQMLRPKVISDGPVDSSPLPAHRAGDPKNGKTVFRFETFGNEGFWTNAARLPQGMAAAQLTPLGALKLGLSFDVEALEPSRRIALTNELNKRFTSGPMLNSHAVLIELLNANAVIGLVVRDTNGDGRLEVENGDGLGVSCTLCHAITDSAVLDNPAGGSIGRRVDGQAAHTLRAGALMALAANTRALFPLAQLEQPDGTSIGRAQVGLTKDSTEAEVDSYFSSPAAYPAGMFDETADGVGNPLQNAPVFRAALAAPWGSGGELATLDDFSNAIYTVSLDPTALLTLEGRTFLHKTAGLAGDRLADDYAQVLEATGVSGAPFVQARKHGIPGEPSSLAGLRVDEQKLVDLNGYLDSLAAPSGAVVDTGAADRGRALFRDAAGCTTCHNVAPMKAVPSGLVPMGAVFPGDDPRTVGQRSAPMGPLLDTQGSTFDDKMIFLNASLRGLERGVAMPVLMDLARKPAFLHDGSVPSLDRLLDPARGPRAPHPFYWADPVQRAELVRFLQRLDDTRK